MKKVFVPISPATYERFYLSQAGFGDPGFYSAPVAIQRGYGLGSVFRSLFRMATPFLKSVGRTLGRQALRTGVNLAEDALAEKNMKEAFKARIKEAGVNLVDQLTQKGKGIKRKRRTRKRPISKKDIFQ